jgi:hypothetical protein
MGDVASEIVNCVGPIEDEFVWTALLSEHALVRRATEVLATPITPL